MALVHHAVNMTCAHLSCPSRLSNIGRMLLDGWSPGAMPLLPRHLITLSTLHLPQTTGNQ